jgi:hypothetical protein
MNNYEIGQIYMYDSPDVHYLITKITKRYAYYKCTDTIYGVSFTGKFEIENPWFYCLTLTEPSVIPIED